MRIDEIFDKWISSKDTTENIIEHLKSLLLSGDSGILPSASKVFQKSELLFVCNRQKKLAKC